MPLGEVLYEFRHSDAPRLFPHHLDRVPALRHGRWRVGPIAVVGNKEIVGVSLLHGRRDHAQPRHHAEGAGHAYRLKGPLLKDEFLAGPMQRLLLRYTQALLTQMAQTAIYGTGP